MIVLPAMGARQEAAWRALISVSQVMPTGWCLVGGQMVYLHCWERGVNPLRPSNDADMVLDVRAHPRIVYQFTAILGELGFVSEGAPDVGHRHRWVNGDAAIDVLIPRHVGTHAALRRGTTGGTLPGAPGGQAAINRAEPVEVSLDGSAGVVPRPTLQGAIAVKAAAYTVRDGREDRHLEDLGVLSTLIIPDDRIRDGLTNTEITRIMSATQALLGKSGLLSTVPGGREGIVRLRMLLGETRDAGGAVWTDTT